MQYCLPSPVEFFGDSGNVEQYFWALKTFKNSDCDSLNASSHMDLQGTFNVWLFLASQGGAISMQMIFRSVELTLLSWKIALDSTICWYASDTDVKLYPAFWHCFMASRVHLTASGKKTQKNWYKRKKKTKVKRFEIDIRNRHCFVYVVYFGAQWQTVRTGIIGCPVKNFVLEQIIVRVNCLVNNMNGN